MQKEKTKSKKSSVATGKNVLDLGRAYQTIVAAYMRIQADETAKALSSNKKRQEISHV